MAKIWFFPYPETGHYNPSFKLAKGLKSRGHQVGYIGFADFEESVQVQGLDFFRILEDLCPKGFLYDKAVKKGRTNFEAMAFEASLRTSADADYDLFREIEKSLKSLQPDLIIIDNMLKDIGRVACKSGLPILFLNTQLYSTWEDLSGYEHLLKFPELVLCPQEFDFPRGQRKKHCYYAESSIDLDRQEAAFPWQMIDNSKPLLYCSLGSQSHLFAMGQNFLQTVIDAMAILQDHQLVISTGSHLTEKDFSALPPNVIMVGTAPQLNLLKKVSIMITHGGFNTVKECIFFGVPMIVFPLIRDHPTVAARLMYHGLGIRAKINDISAEQIAALVKRMESTPSFKTKMELMAAKFRTVEHSGRGVEVTEMILAAYQNDLKKSSAVN